MTIVECFENAPFENTISALTAKPNKIIYIGDHPKMEELVNKHKEFLSSKDITPIIDPRPINKNDLQSIVDELSSIITTEKDCIVDISGGEDLVLMAVGIVYQKYRDTHPFKLQRVDIESGRIIDCDGDNITTYAGNLSMSVDELISLHGGIIIPENPQPSPFADFSDIQKAWDICKVNPATWNKFIEYLHRYRTKTKNNQTALTVQINIGQLTATEPNFQSKYRLMQQYLNELIASNLIVNHRFSNGILSFDYKNDLVKRALFKAGNVLEMKVYFEARNLTLNGAPYFSSCYLGVNIDWDGIIHDRWHRDQDTHNEIDVVLMRGLTPVFISCKNGTVEEGEPYKLCTVANRFGGKHAKKALITTDFSSQNKSEKSLLTRADDMGFLFAPNAAEYTDEDWKNLLIHLA